MDPIEQKRQLIEEAKRRNPNLTRQQAQQLLEEFDRRSAAQTQSPGLPQQAVEFFLPETSKIPGKVARGFEGEVFSREQMAPNAKGNLGASAQNALMQTANLFGAGARPALELASYATPLGVGTKARAGLGALSGLLFGAAQEGATPGDILTTTGAGAVIPGGAALAGKAANAVKGKVGQEAVEYGKDLIVRSLNPTKSQKKNFLKNRGEELGDFLKKEGIVDDFVETTQARLDELQQEFDDLALRDGVTVKVDELRKAFAAPIERFEKAVTPSIKRKADDLKAILDNMAAEYGDDIPLAELTRIRREEFDALLNDRQYQLPTTAAQPLKAARDALQEFIQKETDKFGQSGRLKELGQLIGKYIDVHDIALDRGELPRRTVQLRDLIAGGVGLAGAGPLGFLAGVGINRARQNPTVLRMGSDLFQGAGQALQQGQAQLPDMLMQLLRGAGESASVPKRKPNNEQDDRFEAMRRTQRATQEAQMRRPGLLP